ncbi:MAG: hypothetical protein AAF499_13505 [Pseudomonadota bacterium]
MRAQRAQRTGPPGSAFAVSYPDRDASQLVKTRLTEQGQTPRFLRHIFAAFDGALALQVGQQI